MHSCTSRDACQCLTSSPTPAVTPKQGHRARRREKTSHTPRQVHDSQNERPSETDRGKQRAAQQPECLAMTCSLEGRPHPRAACLASAFGSTRICRMGAAAPAHGCWCRSTRDGVEILGMSALAILTAGLNVCLKLLLQRVSMLGARWQGARMAAERAWS